MLFELLWRRAQSEKRWSGIGTASGAENALPCRCDQIQILLEALSGKVLSDGLRRFACISCLGAASSNSFPQALQKIDTVELIGHPLYSNCTAPSEFRPPPERSECYRSPAFCISESYGLGFRNGPSPLMRRIDLCYFRLFRIRIGLDHASVPAILRRWFQCVFANVWCEELFRESCARVRGIADYRRRISSADDPALRASTLTTPKRCDRHDAALSSSRFLEQIGSSVERRRQMIFVVSARHWWWITNETAGGVRIVRNLDHNLSSARPRRGPSTTDGRLETSAPNVRSQNTSGRSSIRGTPPIPLAFGSQWLTWLSGAAVAALAFGVALWLTRPVEAPPGVAILANSSVSNATALMAAVQTAGLRGTPNVKGAIEGLTRIDAQRVTLTGWAVDRTESSPLLTIIAFADGRHAVTTVTNGQRKDVAQMLGLSDASIRNASFEATLACSPKQTLIIVAVTADRTYSQFGSLTCP